MSCWNVFRSLHLIIFWILFENVMSLHRTKATFIGLLEAGRVNEWVVTEKLGEALKGSKAANKAHRKPRLRFGERYGTDVCKLQQQITFCCDELLIVILARSAFTLESYRIHLLEVGVGAYLFFCGCYDLAFGKNHYFFYLFAQAIAFFIMGSGYVGTFVPNA